MVRRLVRVDEGKHIMIAAPTGGGKSYFTGSHVESTYQRRIPTLILDTKTRNHIGLVGLKKMKLLKIKPGVRYDYRRALREQFLLCIPSPDMRTGPLIDQYNQLLDEAYALKRPRRIYVEEAHLFNPSASKASDVIELLCREGRGYGMDLAIISQRIQNMPKILWSQCKVTYLMKFMIPQDVKYIEAMIPDFSTINRELNLHDVLRYDHVENTYSIIRADQVKRATRHYG